MSKIQDEFLCRAAAVAVRAGHIFPGYAACEAALESAWGTSRLAIEADNLFGQKQSHPPVAGSATIEMPTREYRYGVWVEVPAHWAKFSGWEASFSARMALLRRLSGVYPEYAAALAAKTGEEFVTLVSRRWSTDPERAAKVLAIHGEHRQALAA